MSNLLTDIQPRDVSTGTANYVCLVCFRTSSREPGACARCQVERLALSNPEVCEEVRKAVESRLYRRKSWEIFGFGVISLGPACYLFLNFLWLGFWLGIAIGPVLGWLYAWLRPSSGLAVFAARRKRISAELGMDIDTREYGSKKQPSLGYDFPDSAPAKPSGSRSDNFDPQLMSTGQLLTSLGAKLC